ncbi:MAG: hypothetical protein ACOY4F_14895 [Thermodesulfobacteriota bacterium]
MELTTAQRGIVRAAAEFLNVERYQGAMPRRHTFLYDEKDVKELVRNDYLEWIKLTFSCGKGLKGLRLTDAGRRALEKPVDPRSGPEDLEPEHLDILNDVFHLSKTVRYRGMMPEKKARFYSADDVEDLFARGYLLRVRVKWGEGKKAKGYMVSAKGLRVLREAGRA